MVAPQPFFRPRGTPFSVLHRIRALTEAGHQVDLVTYPFGDSVEIPGLRIYRSSRVPGVRNVRIGPSMAKLMLDIPLCQVVGQRLRSGRYDVLHTHEEAAFFCASLARRHGIPHIYDMHSSLPQQLGNFRAFDFRPVRSLFSRLERDVLRDCDGVITICAELADIARPHVGGKPHMMIENTGDDNRVFFADGFDAARSHELAGQRIVLYTGTLEPYQGIGLLLRAFARVSAAVSDAHLLIVGGSDVQVGRYRREAADLGCGDRITFAGTVHPRLIPGYLRAATVIVSPRSSGTNTPLKIYGYMRSGVPLVATDTRTHTQILDASTACLVVPTDTGIAGGIERLLQDSGYARRLADTARRRAQAEFSDREYCRRVNELYRRVLAWRAEVADTATVQEPQLV